MFCLFDYLQYKYIHTNGMEKSRLFLTIPNQSQMKGTVFNLILLYSYQIYSY